MIVSKMYKIVQMLKFACKYPLYREWIGLDVCLLTDQYYCCVDVEEDDEDNDFGARLLFFALAAWRCWTKSSWQI